MVAVGLNVQQQPKFTDSDSDSDKRTRLRLSPDINYFVLRQHSDKTRRYGAGQLDAASFVQWQN